MASSSRLPDVSVRADAPSSRRSISTNAASASRALTSVASTSISSPYAGLSSSASSSSSLSTPKRHSIASASRISLSRYSNPSPSGAAATLNDDSPHFLSRRSGSTSSANDAHSTDPAKYPAASSSRSITSAAPGQRSSPRYIDPAASARRVPSRSTAQHSPTTQRRRSAESLRLDLDGLDLGGTTASAAPFDNAAGLPHTRSHSNTNQPSSTANKPAFRTYNGIDVAADQFCDSCATAANSHHAVNGIEDSFSLHLREECSDYREIMSSQVVLNAAIDKEQRTPQSANFVSDDRRRSRGYSITHGQVLGGFASLGLQTESSLLPSAPARQQPVRTTTKGSTDSSEAPATPIEWRDSFGADAFNAPPDNHASSSSSSPKWAHLAARPCNPHEPLDVLSIEEMGLHSLDVGSLNDWEGCKLSAEILCSVNGHQRIEWSVAQTTRRNKKWVVVPNATVTCGVTEKLSAADQAERTVVVSSRSLWLQGAEAGAAPSYQPHSPTKPTSSSQQRPTAPGVVVGPSHHRSSMPFSGKAGFELCLLRPASGRICPPVYLANASTHRYLRQHNRELDLRATQIHGRIAPDTAAERRSVKISPPAYPVLRRSRSRPYLRKSQTQLRRSRSKPYLPTSGQQPSALPAATGVNPELFAPSLPGDPSLRTHPGESWPSARSRRSGSLSSLDSASGSDAASDTWSLADAARSTTNTRESMTASVSSASDDPVASMDGQRAGRSAAIPMAAGGAHAQQRQLRSLSPGSSASRGISSHSEASAAFAGWQHAGHEQQRVQKQGSHSNSYEAESWLGTSPTTASASSMSASSKQNRSRNGFQRAMQKKDKMLSSWFKRRPDNSSTPTSVSPVTDSDKTQPSISVTNSVGMQPSASTADTTNNGDRRSSQAKAGAANGTTPLTETALETFQRAMFRPASPESTIMGSRRGSEALTQKTVEPPANDVAQRSAQPSAQSGAAHLAAVQATHEGTSGAENRQAVNSTLSQVYGWDAQQAASKILQPAADVTEVSSSGFLQDLDEENALLGLDAVPAGALTMLIPLPLIGRSRAQDAVAYMRVNFVPFNSSASGGEVAPGMVTGSMQFGGSPGAESASTLPHSVSSGSNHLVERSSAAKSSEQSSWKRKLGLSNSRSGNSAPQTGGGGGGVGGQSTNSSNGPAMVAAASQPDFDVAQKSPQFAPSKFEPFRVTAIVHDAPWASRSSTEVDPRLPEPSAFPVVLGYCNDSKGLEMVPEGWASLRLGGPMPTKADGTPLDGEHPSRGVTDLIIAACIAVMDM